jgi:hypothetical protein
MAQAFAEHDKGESSQHDHEFQQALNARVIENI